MALQRFPLITPMDADGKVFRGFLPVHVNKNPITIVFLSIPSIYIHKV